MPKGSLTRSRSQRSLQRLGRVSQPVASATKTKPTGSENLTKKAVTNPVIYRNATGKYLSKSERKAAAKAKVAKAKADKAKADADTAADTILKKLGDTTPSVSKLSTPVPVNITNVIKNVAKTSSIVYEVKKKQLSPIAQISKNISETSKKINTTKKDINNTQKLLNDINTKLTNPIIPLTSKEQSNLEQQQKQLLGKKSLQEEELAKLKNTSQLTNTQKLILKINSNTRTKRKKPQNNANNVVDIEKIGIIEKIPDDINLIQPTIEEIEKITPNEIAIYKQKPRKPREPTESEKSFKKNLQTIDKLEPSDPKSFWGKISQIWSSKSQTEITKLAQNDPTGKNIESYKSQMRQSLIAKTTEDAQKADDAHEQKLISNIVLEKRVEKNRAENQAKKDAKNSAKKNEFIQSLTTLSKSSNTDEKLPSTIPTASVTPAPAPVPLQSSVNPAPASVTPASTPSAINTVTYKKFNINYGTQANKDRREKAQKEIEQMTPISPVVKDLQEKKNQIFNKINKQEQTPPNTSPKQQTKEEAKQKKKAEKQEAKKIEEETKQKQLQEAKENKKLKKQQKLLLAEDKRIDKLVEEEFPPFAQKGFKDATLLENGTKVDINKIKQNMKQQLIDNPTEKPNFMMALYDYGKLLDSNKLSVKGKEFLATLEQQPGFKEYSESLKSPKSPVGKDL